MGKVCETAPVVWGDGSLGGGHVCRNVGGKGSRTNQRDRGIGEGDGQGLRDCSGGGIGDEQGYRVGAVEGVRRNNSGEGGGVLVGGGEVALGTGCVEGQIDVG